MMAVPQRLSPFLQSTFQAFLPTTQHCQPTLDPAPRCQSGQCAHCPTCIICIEYAEVKWKHDLIFAPALARQAAEATTQHQRTVDSVPTTRETDEATNRIAELESQHERMLARMDGMQRELQGFRKQQKVSATVEIDPNDPSVDRAMFEAGEEATDEEMDDPSEEATNGGMDDSSDEETDVAGQGEYDWPARGSCSWREMDCVLIKQEGSEDKELAFATTPVNKLVPVVPRREAVLPSLRVLMPRQENRPNRRTKHLSKSKKDNQPTRKQQPRAATSETPRETTEKTSRASSRPNLYTQEEDETILQGVKKKYSWSKIQEVYLPGRTPEAIRSRMRLLRKKRPELNKL